MVVIFIGIVIKEIGLIYCRNSKINYILKKLKKIISFYNWRRNKLNNSNS